MRIVRWIGWLMLLLLCLTITPDCSDSNNPTLSQSEYARNKRNDLSNPLTEEELIGAIGFMNYQTLITSIGRDELDRLVYGPGLSNFTILINIIGDVNKLVDLLTGSNALVANEVVDLLDKTDTAIAEENPPSDDTIGKIANLINNVEDMNYLKDIVHGVVTFNGKTGMERLTLMVALVDEYRNTMPIILNQTCNVYENQVKLLRILNNTLDLRKLTTIINELTALENMTGIINNITNPNNGSPQVNPDGTYSLITTLNRINNPSILADLINNLNVTGVVGNDDNFETGDFKAQNWALSGNQQWKVTSDGSHPKAACIGKAGINPLGNGQIASLEMTVNLTVSGAVSYARRVSSESGKDYLKFYVDDVLVNITSGDASWGAASSATLGAGIHRLRWEYEKDDTGSAGDDCACIDDITVPGNRGADLLPYKKVAILLNRLTLSSENTISDVLNGLTQVGLNNIVNVINKTAFPSDAGAEPKMVTIANNLTAVSTLVSVLNNLVGDAASKHVVDVIDYATDITKVYRLINELNGPPGEKMYLILNGLDGAGAAAMVRILNGVSLDDMKTIVNGAISTSYMPEIFNNLALHGSSIVTTGQTSYPTASGRMIEIINTISGGGYNLTISYHMVRLVNDLSGGSGAMGASFIGKILSGLKNPEGVPKMIGIMNNLYQNDESNKYTDPLCGGTGEYYYPVYTYSNTSDVNLSPYSTSYSNISVTGGPTSIWDARAKVNVIYDYDTDLELSLISPASIEVPLAINRGGLNANYINTVFDDAASTAISSGSAPFTGTYRPESLLSAFDGQNSNGTWRFKVKQEYCCYYGKIDSWTLYITERQVAGSVGCTTDIFGRLTTFINDLGATGADNTVNLINSVNLSKISNLTNLIKDVKRIRYISDVINNLSNVKLMATILNDPVLQVSRMRQILDTMGNKSYPAHEPPSPRYTDAMSTATNDGLGRLTVLINEVVTTDGATNIVRIMNDMGDLNKLTGLLCKINLDGTARSGGGMDRVRYLSDIINHVQNIDLLLNILNGFTSPSTPPVDYTQLVRLVNEIGASERKGSGSKPQGDCSIVWSTINKLGWDYDAGAQRPAAEQAKLIYILNGTRYCGVQSSYDTNDPGNHLISEDPSGCSCADTTLNGKKRLTQFMLGMNDAQPVSIIVGDVTDYNKTINVLNGMRDIRELNALINYLPGEVTSAFLNELNAGVVYSGAVYLLNRLLAKEMACIMHYGTGIGDGTSRTGTVTTFTGFGPKRCAKICNAARGTRIKALIDQYGWRTLVPALVCGFGTPNAPTKPQVISSDIGLGNITFPQIEYIDIHNDQTPGGRGSYRHYYEYISSECDDYYPEQPDDWLMCSTTSLDIVIYSGFTFKWGAICAIPIKQTVKAGVQDSIWDFVNQEGLLYNLVTIGGIDVPDPPSPKWWATGNIDPAVNAPIIKRAVEPIP